MGPQSPFLILFKTGPEGASGSSGGGGGASSNSDVGSSSNNTIDGTALIAKNLEVSKDLEVNSLIPKCDLQPSVIDAIKQRFPLKDPRNVPESVVLYVS